MDLEGKVLDIHTLAYNAKAGMGNMLARRPRVYNICMTWSLLGMWSNYELMSSHAVNH